MVSTFVFYYCFLRRDGGCGCVEGLQYAYREAPRDTTIFFVLAGIRLAPIGCTFWICCSFLNFLVAGDFLRIEVVSCGLSLESNCTH